MGGIYVSFEDQKHQEADLTIKAMATQIGINLGISVLITITFCILRPKHTLVYAPKYKYSTDLKRPPTIGTGLFDWIRPLFTAKDDFLLTRIGYDAVLFLKFLRLLRHMLLIMTVVGVCALIPINIVATQASGDWPPAPGIDFLSISGINYVNGKLSTQPDLRWYWAPFAATWLFSLVVVFFLHRFSAHYIQIRRRYFQQDAQERETAKTILISNIPHHIRSDKALKDWVESSGVLPHPITDCLIGKANAKLTALYEEHELAVEHLEIALASYLNDGKKLAKQRPTMRVNGFLGFGGTKVDVIEYYTNQVSDLDKKIKKSRDGKSKASNFGWLSFAQVQHAQAAETALNRYHRSSSSKDQLERTDARPSPPPRNLLWANLPLDRSKRKMKRYFGRIVYWIFTMAWMIPIGALSATSNLINLIRLIPNSDSFIENHTYFMGMVSAYFTPIVMALFFLLLPFFFRFLSQQQGYRTQTTLDRKVFLKLYGFFLINNLLVFTLVSIFVGIYGQIRALIDSQALSDNDSNVGDYILQIAKNISDVSSFWIAYVCTKGLGLTMELCQLVPLVTLAIRKWVSRPSPRELREYARPPIFDYPQGYSILVFFFTVALLYSAMAPLILPFALMYVTVSSLVYKYMLMYIYVTKMESGGKMWPVLFQTMNVGVVLFQVIMIIVLSLKGGYLQCYCLIPLPVLTVAFQWLYGRRLTDINCYILDPKTSNWLEQQQQQQHLSSSASTSKKSSTITHSLKSQFRDPAAYHKLSSPMVHDDVKHLLPQVYHQMSHPKETIEMMTRKHSATTPDHNLPNTPTNKGYSTMMNKGYSTMMKMDLDNGLAINFCTMTETDVIETVTEDDSGDDDDNDIDDEMRTTGQRQEESYYTNNTVKSGRIADILDTDDEMEEEQRGLVQNDHMDQYWQRHDQHSIPSSSLSLLPPVLGSTKILVDQDVSDREVLDWKLERKGVTSEFVDLYESFPASDQDMIDLPMYLPHPLPQAYMERRCSDPSLFAGYSGGRPLHHSDIPNLRRSQSLAMMPPYQHIDQQRRLSHPSFTHYVSASHPTEEPQHDSTIRRHSMPTIDDTAVNERQGHWIAQMDNWHRAQHRQQPSRTRSVYAPDNQGLPHRVLQRSHSLQHGPHHSSSNQQQHYFDGDGDGRIRITYYDDMLMEHPEDEER